MISVFIKKLSLYFLICFGIVTFILLKFGQDVDPFYVKFTTPKVNSMIIGDSRSLQGLNPSVFNEKLKKEDYSLPMFNFSFTTDQARIGPLYRKSILRKLNKNSDKGLFIIALDGIMMASDIKKDNMNGEFWENNQPPHNMFFVDKNPNYEYFIKNLSYFDFRRIFKKKYTTHKDGFQTLKYDSNKKQMLKI